MELVVRAHNELTERDLELLQGLFDREYLARFGPWDPDAPYGYSPADVHIIAYASGDSTPHAAIHGQARFQRRRIAVGDRAVTVAGTGGVLVAPEARGTGLGHQLMNRALDAMVDATAITDIEYGYLGCSPEVVPFYESSGWHRIHARERHTSRLEPTTIIDETHSPILICPAGRSVDEWPCGDIDLHGTPW